MCVWGQYIADRLGGLTFSLISSKTLALLFSALVSSVSMVETLPPPTPTYLMGSLEATAAPVLDSGIGR